MQAEKSRRGFAAMEPELRIEFARRGGIRAHQLGRAYKWDSAAAKAAGQKNRGKRRTPEQRARMGRREA